MLEALECGRLRGVGLDVHWNEPADPQDPLYRYPGSIPTLHLTVDYTNRHPGVLAMPHAGVAAQEVYEAYAELLVSNIEARRNNQPLKHVLNLH